MSTKRRPAVAPAPEETSVDWVAEVKDQVLAQLTERPYVAIAAAAAAGYVLGGGVPRWAVRYGTQYGKRLLVEQVVKAVTAAAA